ncbi:MAG: carbonic anhydrase family protein [Tenacibaculum sp.]
MKAHTKESQAAITPEKGLQLLKAGNLRFQDNVRINRNLIEQVNDTKNGQYPFASILSCIDSRVPAELIFDQGLGDIFNVRVAGNFVNDDILGSLEFACKLAGTKLIVVLGHTSCGAIKGACDNAELGKLTNMLTKIKPAVDAVSTPTDIALRKSSNTDFVNQVATKNVHLAVSNIKSQSQVLSNMHKNGEILIIGAMYYIDNGSVVFFQ